MSAAERARHGADVVLFGRRMPWVDNFVCPKHSKTEFDETIPFCYQMEHLGIEFGFLNGQIRLRLTALTRSLSPPV